MKLAEIKTLILNNMIVGKEITPQRILYNLGIDTHIIQIHQALNQLHNEGKVNFRESDGGKIFTLVVAKPDKVKLKQTRDTSTYLFENVKYNKSRLVHAIIKKYCAENTTFEQLEAVFPKDLVKPYGLYDYYNNAVEVSKDRKRFFIADHEVINLQGDLNHKICVSNQMTSERLETILKICKELKYEVVVCP